MLVGVRIIKKNMTDYSHYLIVDFDGVVFRLEVGYVSDKNSEWLLYFSLDRFYQRLLWFFYINKCNSFASLIHKILRECQEIYEIRWYKNKKNWNFNSEEFEREPTKGDAH